MTKIEELVQELKDNFDYIEKYDAVKFLCRFNTINRTYVTINEALKSYNIAY